MKKMVFFVLMMFVLLTVSGCGIRWARNQGVEAPAASEITYPVTVDCSMTLIQMIEAGGYIGYFSEVINQDNFPITGQGKTEVVLQLVNMGKDATTADVLAEMDRRGLRPATLPELLALGAKYPELQVSFPIIALGSVHKIGNTDFVTYLNSIDNSWDVRFLGFESNKPGDTWKDFCRFLAAKKPVRKA